MKLPLVMPRTFLTAYMDVSEFAGQQKEYAEAGAIQQASKGNKVNSDKLALRLYLMARKEGNKEHDLRIGDFYYYGKGGISRNLTIAAKYYRQASAHGVAQAAYSLGTMYEKGEISAGGNEVVPCNSDNEDKCHSDDESPTGIMGAAERALAKKYFQRTLELNPAPEIEVVIKLALQRMEWRQWIDRLVDPSRPWVTPVMENILIALAVIILTFLYAMSQNFFIRHSLHVDEMINVGEAEVAGTNLARPEVAPEVSSRGNINLPSNPTVEEQERVSKGESSKPDCIDGIPISKDIVNTYTLMAQHINMLHSYKSFCAASMIQQWYRRLRKKTNDSSTHLLCFKGQFFDSAKERHEAFQKRKKRMLLVARKRYLSRR